MNLNLKFLIPNKKTVIFFAIFSIIMGIASLQVETFSEKEPSIFLKALYWMAEPTWKVWLYLSAPVLFFAEGILPQTSLRWFNPKTSWEMVYALNFVYYYFMASILAYLWNGISKNKSLVKP